MGSLKVYPSLLSPRTGQPRHSVGWEVPPTSPTAPSQRAGGYSSPTQSGTAAGRPLQLRHGQESYCSRPRSAPPRAEGYPSPTAGQHRHGSALLAVAPQGGFATVGLVLFYPHPRAAPQRVGSKHRLAPGQLRHGREINRVLPQGSTAGQAGGLFYRLHPRVALP